jgi:tRNA/rRNA methyltransferase
MSRFRVVIARPAGLANVGSVARLCVNFGCANLRVVAPQFDYGGALEAGLSGEMGWYARHHGLALLDDPDAAREHKTVAESVADCSTVVGFSRRRGRGRAAGLQVG